MSEVTDIGEGSVVEYSLAELGFVLVFVLLLLSGWEINSNASRSQEQTTKIAETERQLEALEKENETLLAAISMTPPGVQEFPDDFMFVDKKEYFALQAQSKNGNDFANMESSVRERIIKAALEIETPPDDPIIVSMSDQEKLEKAQRKLEQENERLKEQLAGDSKGATSPEPIGGKVGTVGFCTYDEPSPGSTRVYGKSVAIGTLMVEEDGLTLVEKNSSIQHRKLVDIAGENYDTSLVAEALDNWPLNKKLSPRQFQRISEEFLTIGDIYSEKRVACRFGMDYFRPIYSKKSADMLKNVLEGSFFKNSQLDENAFFARFPQYKKTPFPKSDVPDSMMTSPIEKLSGAKVIFPRRAERAGISGKVELRYTVSIYGLATNIKIVKDEPPGKGFSEAAIAALEQYRFKPAMVNGSPIESEIQILKFKF